MSDNKTTARTSGISFMTVLFFIFLILKLTGTIGWSWWWITAPLWGGLALFLLVILIAAIVALLYVIFRGSKDW